MTSLPRALTLGLAFALLAGCGAKTLPEGPGTTRDAGPRMDAGGRPDAGTDAGMPTLEVDCGRSVQYTSPRRPLTVEAIVTSPDPIVSQSWVLNAMDPPDASATFTPGPAPSQATLTPDTEGNFVLIFNVTDAAGRDGFCNVNVRSVVGPPIALCPEMVVSTDVGVPVQVVGDGYDDDMVVAYSWAIVELPGGSRPRIDPTDTPMTEFLSPDAGDYVLELTVTDPDMATGTCRAPVFVNGPPEVRCPMSPIRAPTRQPVNVTATATDATGPVVSTRWELLSQPPSSTATLSPTDAETTTMTPDKQGDYQLRFTATDGRGLSGSCDVTVIGEPTPPTLTCPMVVTTPPLTPVDVTAMAVDDGMIVSWSWDLTGQPVGSAAAPPSPANAPTTTFTPDIAGVYTLTVTVRDDDGMMASCMTRVEAGNVDGLRVEMFWDTPGTDMDLHLLNQTGMRWGSGDDDCYYGNCTGGSLEWGGAGSDDNPRLDIDDTNGFGPENINILRPQNGTYRVGVHAFRGNGSVTVRIYCGGSTTVPRQTFGPVSIRDRGGSQNADLWRVADVTFSGAACTITDLTDAAGAPNVRSPYRTTSRMR